MQLIITFVIGIIFFVYIKNSNKLINNRIDKIEKNLLNLEDYKKHKDDIKTLFQNQQLLLSLVNAVRVRINNFYAKKLKEPKLKSAGFESSKELGEN